MAMSDDSNITDINGHEDRALSGLYRSAERPQPPASLDATIKSAARAGPRRRRVHALQWLGGLAASLLAAVLLMQLYPRAIQEPELAGGAREAPMREPTAQPLEERKARRSVIPEDVSPLAPRMPAPAASLRSEGARDAESKADRGSAEPEASPDRKRELPATKPEEPRGNPDADLQTITGLLDSGDMPRARQRLAEFRARYPGFEIPETVLRRFREAESGP
jgi:hypothetical protein